MRNAAIALLLYLLPSASAWAQDPPIWDSGTPMPTPRKEIANAAVALGGEVYVLGGLESPGTVSDAVEVYDPATDTWRSAAALPLPVWRSSAAVANGRIYLFGGYQPQPQRSFPFNPTNRVFEYDPDTDSWTEKASMGTTRGALSAVTMDGEIHVVGGANNDAVATHEIYDPVADEWRFAATMTTTRSGLTTAVAGGKLYAFGGYVLGGNGVIRRTTAEVYDPEADNWSLIANPPQARVGIDAVSRDGRIIVIGGSDTAGSRTILYDPAADAWSDLPDMPVPVNFMGVAQVGDTVVAAGGGPENLNQFDMVDNTRLLTFATNFEINQGVSDAWFNADTAGQGFFIIVFPDVGILFMAWFTYDTERPPNDIMAMLGEPGHRWVTAQGPFDGNSAVLDVFLTEGGIFDMAEPEPVTGEDPVGTITLVWQDCENAILTYDINPPGVMGEIPIRRIVPDNAALCEALANP